MRVLIVDDDPNIQNLITANLKARGYEVGTASDGKAAIRELMSAPWDAMFLDLRMPGLDGLEVIRRVRPKFSLPIIVISALGEEATKVEALDLGADDYLTKPFGIPELLARLRAVQRRYGAPEGPLRYGEITLDPQGGFVRAGDRELRLTPTESALLHHLLKRAGQTVTHAELLDAVWGRGEGDLHYLHVYVGRLRKKLAGALRIEAIPGVGYRILRTF